MEKNVDITELGPSLYKGCTVYCCESLIMHCLSIVAYDQLV